MTDLKAITEKFANLNICVIIPTYNNAGTLAGVINDVASYTHNIIVVNDGSTDNTAEIIASFPFIQSVSYIHNVGKGWALRMGFKHAISLNYEYAITIDSDGQHFAKDLPMFVNKIEEAPGTLIIGARNMNQSSVPGKSSFGHKFSNFWFKVETNINCPDTQSGFRLYPLQRLKNLKFITRKYEFEIEVLVRAAWKGVQIESVPVTVYYAPKETRVSHFRPFQDFTRVSILNVFLVIITFAYIKPRDFFRTIFSKKKVKQVLAEQLFSFNQSNRLKAASIGLGVCMGIMPIWGFQLWVGLLLAAIFRLNKVLVVIASNISIPPMIPFVIFFSFKTGSLWMGNKGEDISFIPQLSLSSVSLHMQQYIYGSITLAIAAGIVAGLTTFILLKQFSRKAASAL